MHCHIFASVSSASALSSLAFPAAASCFALAPSERVLSSSTKRIWPFYQMQTCSLGLEEFEFVMLTLIDAKIRIA